MVLARQEQVPSQPSIQRPGSVRFSADSSSCFLVAARDRGGWIIQPLRSSAECSNRGIASASPGSRERS